MKLCLKSHNKGWTLTENRVWIRVSSMSRTKVGFPSGFGATTRLLWEARAAVEADEDPVRYEDELPPARLPKGSPLWYFERSRLGGAVMPGPRLNCFGATGAVVAAL